MLERYMSKQYVAKAQEIRAELETMYGKMIGAVRLHWESDADEAKAFTSLDAALDEVAEQAVEHDMTADEIERIAYIVTEDAYKAES